jgi:predicted nucleic acid-binding protein
VTSRRAAGTPSPGPDALAAMAALSSRGGAVFLGETRRHLELLEELLTPPAVSGAVVHDAKIAAICLGHGVDELWTADRDYGYFPALSTRNPLVSR